MTHLSATHRAGDEVRRGSAALVLILFLTLLVGSIATTTIQRASNERRMELQKTSIATLESAIETAENSGLATGEKVRLPLTETPERWIVVESDSEPDTKSSYNATLFQNDQPGLSIRRFKRNES